MVMIEAPRLLFPFARAIVSDVTRDGGFMPLNIQPVDFVAVYQHNLAKQQEAASETKRTADQEVMALALIFQIGSSIFCEKILMR